MATGSARGNSHRCGALEGKAVVAGCKARQDVSSDAPNETQGQSPHPRARVAASWTNYLLESYASERGAVRYIARLGALALVPGVATIGFVLSYLKW